MSENSEVKVQFSMTESNWDTVVEEGLFAGEELRVEKETTQYFVVSYENKETFQKALSRFDGMVEYKIIQ